LPMPMCAEDARMSIPMIGIVQGKLRVCWDGEETHTFPADRTGAAELGRILKDRGHKVWTYSTSLDVNPHVDFRTLIEEAFDRACSPAGS